MLKASLLLVTLAAAGLGCSQDGDVHDRQANQKVSDDGMTATRTRSQLRDTPSGATVKETEVQTREVVKSPTTAPDARLKDPAK